MPAATPRKPAVPKSPPAKEPTKEPAGTATDEPSGAAALERVRPSLAALKPAQLLPLRLNLQLAATAVLGVLEYIEGRKLRPRFEKLAGIGEFDAKALTDLPDLARALYFVRNRHAQATAGASEAMLPGSLVAAAQEVRARMLKVAAYGLEDDDDAARQIAFIRKGTGHRDLADDLMSLAALYRAHKDALADSGRHYRAADEREAAERAAEIVRRLGEHDIKPGDAATADLSDLSARCGTRLFTAYDQVAAAGRFLCRDERDVDERFPSLYFIGRGGRTGKKNRPDGDTPAPARNKR